MGEVARMPDGAYSFPLFIWDGFTGDEIWSGALDINYNYSAIEWRAVQR